MYYVLEEIMLTRSETDITTTFKKKPKKPKNPFFFSTSHGQELFHKRRLNSAVSHYPVTRALTLHTLSRTYIVINLAIMELKQNIALMYSLGLPSRYNFHVVYFLLTRTL